MAKTEVYSWRLDPELKQELEAVARGEKTSVGAVIERACRDMLDKTPSKDDEADEQARLRKAVMKVVGSVDGPGVSATNKNLRDAFATKRLHDQMRRGAPKPR